MNSVIAPVDAHLAANPIQPTHGVAQIYVSVKPILQIAVGLLFFKPSWQRALQAFMAALDVEFPQ